MNPNPGPLETIYEQEKRNLNYLSSSGNAYEIHAMKNEMKDKALVYGICSAIAWVGTYLVRQIAPESNVVIAVGDIATMGFFGAATGNMMGAGLTKWRENTLPRRIEAQRQLVKGLENDVVEEIMRRAKLRSTPCPQ